MKAHEKQRSRKGNLEIKLESGNEGNLEKWKLMKKTKSRKGNLEIKLESGNEGNLEKLKLMKKKGNPEKEIWK